MDLRDRFDVKINESIIEVYLGGEKVCEWNDDTLINAPEDLIWHREIGNLFFGAVAVGLKLAMLELKKVFQDQHKKAEVIQNFASTMEENMQDLDPEFSKIVDEHFWELM